MSKQRTGLLAVVVVGALAVLSGMVQAEIIYSESFDYGDSGTGINNLDNWSSSSAVLKYDPNGLEHPGLAGTIGGSMWLDYDDGRTATDSTPSHDIGGLEVGAVLWYAVLMEHNHDSGTAEVRFTAGGTVNDVYMRLLSSGQAQLNLASSGNISGSPGANRSTGVNAADGETALLLLKVTKGSPINSPTDSEFAFWLNPSDTSSESALGDPDWSASNGLFGREDSTWGSVAATPSEYGRIDEIRVGTTLASVTGGGSAVVIVNAGATDVTHQSATLEGSLTLNEEDLSVDVSVHWSTNNHTSVAAWEGDATAGSAVVGTYVNVEGQVLSHSVGGLRPETQYYFTFIAETADETKIRATPNGSFTTLEAPAGTILIIK